MDQKSKLILAQYTVDALNILDHSISLYAEGHEASTVLLPHNCGFFCVIPIFATANRKISL